MKKQPDLAITMSVDQLIAALEEVGLQWDIGHTGGNIEARVWDWPSVIGRFRSNDVIDLGDMLWKACEDAGLTKEVNRP